MEAGGPEIRHLPHIPHGIFPALSAALFIAMGYIDLGKWAACIDCGVRFGGDLSLFLFLFNLMAIVCQYLSVHIGVVTGKNLAQICSAEYGQFNRIFLGIQAEVSILMSDLAMILGIANGLHMILKVDLFVAVILAALDAIFYPLLSVLLVNSKAKGFVVRIAGLIFFFYVLGLLIGLPEISISPIGMPSKLNGENVYAMISLLGANIMPHNFYLHSSIVQRFQGSNGEARAHWVYESFFSIFAIFSSIFLVNYALMNSASNVLYSSEHVLSTFQDAMSLMNQSLWSPMRPLGFLLLISSSHISGLSWGINREGKQPILCDFFGIDLPGWLHCATVRIFATIPALYCLRYSGAEGMYHMLISTQIMVGLLLPASVVALCQIAASRAIMGASKISAVTEFFMMISLMAMIGLQIVFLGEMVFGDSAWLGYLRWNMGTTSITSHSFILIFSGWASLCFTFRIFVTPLRSADERPNAQEWSLVSSEGLHVSLAERQENDDMAGSVPSEEQVSETNTTLSAEKVVETHSADLTPIEEETALPESIPVPEANKDCSDNQPVASNEPKVETADLDEKTPLRSADEWPNAQRVRSESLHTEEPFLETNMTPSPEKVVETHSDMPAPNYGADLPRTVMGTYRKAYLTPIQEITQEEETELPESVPVPEVNKDWSNNQPVASNESKVETRDLVEKPATRKDGDGNGAGLGRSARRQLATTLDEFWGHLYDYHGQLTQEAKANKLNLLLDAASSPKSSPSLAKADSGRSDSPTNSIQLRLPSAIGSAYGANKVSPSPSMWSNTIQEMRVHQSTKGQPVADEDSHKKYYSLPNVSKYTFPAGQTCFSDTYDQLRILNAARKRGPLFPTVALRGAPPGFDEPSSRKRAKKTIESDTSIGDSEQKLLQSLKFCILKLLILEGSGCLFKQIDGADEDLIERVAARERFSYQSKVDLKNMVSPVPHCGEACVWKADLIFSFGVWCIHRILEFSRTECRPELWGKYTYVLNRLQGVIDPAFFKHRIPMPPCTCLQITAANQQKVSPFPNGALPPTARPPNRNFTTAPTLLDIIKDVEVGLSNKKGRSGTITGDIAYPKGKENLASVLKRYKRRLSNKPVGP